MPRSPRFKLLLQHGYFPVELPPPYHTRDLARFRNSIASKWSKLPNSYPATVQENYTIPRPSQLRRNLALVNPISQVHLSQLIAANWIEIRKHFRKPQYSFEVPRIELAKDRAIAPPDFDLFNLKRMEVSSDFEYALSSDISRFYGTLYTHAIAWALHGKSWCKTNLHKPAYKNSLGNRLDTAIRKGQDNQSVGIPVGPDTSRIISELVGVSIDSLAQHKLKLEPTQAYRQIDDWFIGFDSLGEAESAVAHLAAACHEFEMELNAEKTRTFHAASSVPDVWPEELRRFSFGTNAHRQRKSIEHYFVRSFNYADEYTSQNVLDFAIKRTRTIRVFTDNWETYEMYLLKAGRSSPMVIPSIVQVFASYNRDGYPINKGKVQKFVEDILEKHSPVAHHQEVSWSLFLAKALGLKLSRSAVISISNMNSSVCALLALDLEARGQIRGRLDKSSWSRSMSSDGLRSSMWLLAYEADLKGWLRGTASGYVEADPYFKELKTRRVSFYDEQRNVVHISKVGPARVRVPFTFGLMGSGA